MAGGVKVMLGDKVLRPVKGRLCASGAPFEGYEMHLGRTSGPGAARPFLMIDGVTPDGAVSPDGKVAGAYVHGLFAKGASRKAILADLGAGSLGADHDLVIDQALDEIAEALEQSLDVAALSRIAGLAP